MNDEAAYEINVKGLDQLLKSLNGKLPIARVGIIGSKVKPHLAKKGEKAPKGAPTNADIGAVHEFGVPARNIEQRSFLRVPISEYLQKYLEKSGAFDADTLSEVLKLGSVLPWLKKVAISAETVSIDAFATGGFGQWAPWKIPGYMNNGGMLLVDTKQLRDSVTSEVR